MAKHRGDTGKDVGAGVRSGAPLRVTRAVARAARAHFITDLIRLLGWGLVIGMLGAVCAVLTLKIIGIEPELAWQRVLPIVAPGAIAAIVCAGIAWRRRWSPTRAASELDHASNLRDRIGSALTLATRGQIGPFEQMAIGEGEAAAAEARPGKVAKLSLGWPWAMGPALGALAVALMLYIPVASWGASEQRESQQEAARAELSQEADFLEQDLREALAIDPRNSDAELERAIDELLRGVRDGDLSRDQAREAMIDRLERAQREQEILDRIERDASEIRADRLAEAAQEVRDRLEDDGVRKLADALASGDFARAADALEEIDRRLEELDPADRDRIARQLRDLQESIERQQASQPQRDRPSSIDSLGFDENTRSELREEVSQDRIAERLREEGIDPIEAEDLAERIAQENMREKARQQAEESLGEVAENLKGAAEGVEQLNAPPSDPQADLDSEDDPDAQQEVADDEATETPREQESAESGEPDAGEGATGETGQPGESGETGEQGEQAGADSSDPAQGQESQRDDREAPGSDATGSETPDSPEATESTEASESAEATGADGQPSDQPSEQPSEQTQGPPEQAPEPSEESASDSGNAGEAERQEPIAGGPQDAPEDGEQPERSERDGDAAPIESSQGVERESGEQDAGESQPEGPPEPAEQPGSTPSGEAQPQQTPETGAEAPSGDPGATPDADAPDSEAPDMEAPEPQSTDGSGEAPDSEQQGQPATADGEACEGGQSEPDGGTPGDSGRRGNLTETAERLRRLAERAGDEPQQRRPPQSYEDAIRRLTDGLGDEARERMESIRRERALEDGAARRLADQRDGPVFDASDPDREAGARSMRVGERPSDGAPSGVTRATGDAPASGDDPAAAPERAIEQEPQRPWVRSLYERYQRDRGRREGSGEGN